MPDIPTDVLIPRKAKLHRIESKYGPLEDEVRCGLEGCGTPHKHGFVVSFGDPDAEPGNNLGIVGHVCGKRSFGVSWVEAERIFDAKVRDAKVQAAAERFRAQAGHILPELEAALPRLKRHQNVREVLSRQVPMLMRVCQEAAEKNQGQIRLARGRDFVTVHQLEGRLFWMNDRALGRARELDLSIRDFVNFMNGSDAEPRDIERRLSQLGDVRHTWELVCKWMVAADSALRPQHLQSVMDAVGRLPDPFLVDLGVGRSAQFPANLRIVDDLLQRRYLIAGTSDRYTWSTIANLRE